ncbi:TPA: methionine biosynthesis protein MetW [Candidatus Sumerlaeota bacterium]|jgi:methionine biosynthesis protein MetW|nr:methionine biosynthesis protein MetW [Candidatus Sumerlaeota bacterium]
MTHPHPSLTDPNVPAIFAWISSQTPMTARVIDIGCGDGALLARLASERGARSTGIELSEDCIALAVQRGVSVHHGNVEEGLDHYSDQSFDLAILCNALQEMHHPHKVLQESFRVGKRVLIVFPNFAHWKARWQIAVQGRAPRTSTLPHEWDTTPNQHFFSISDWEHFCKKQGWRIVASSFLSNGRKVSFLPNLYAEIGMFLMEE